MEKIRIDEKLFIFLDHRKLINESFNIKESDKYALRPELFDFQPKESNRSNQQNEDEIPKKRKKLKKHSFQEISNEFLHLTEAIKGIPELLPTVPNQEPMERVWEQTSNYDFPKFKGANNSSSFQRIENFVKNISFIVPPNCRFYNYDIDELRELIQNNELSTPYDLIVLDPPWRNKYIRRLKNHRLGYDMVECEKLQNIPIGKIVSKSSVVAIWCTNSKQHQGTLLQLLLPAWNLRLLHTIKWLKINTLGEPILPLNSFSDHNGKKPYEMLYIACHVDALPDFGAKLFEVEMIMSIPSIIHSHKLPLLKWLSSYFDLNANSNCLELFARYLMPNFTSIGKEVLKLMDARLYYDNCQDKSLHSS